MQMDFLIIVHIEQVQIMSASAAVVLPQNGDNRLAVLSKVSECWGDASSSKLDKDVLRLGDDITAKVRKPYTTTKQRERWTAEEHQKFLDALKLHGRAWRQIEEHVGTKTAVQIRSHAQKFFSKLEREGSSGSVEAPVSEIDIPPPRPKRKPTHPYPRKGIAHSSQNVSLSSQVSGIKSPGCELSLPCDTAVVAEKVSPVGSCGKPRKRGTDEVAFPNEIQEMPKLFRSACSELGHSSSQSGVSALQPDTLMCQNANMPLGMYGSRWLTNSQQMTVPYQYPLHSMATLENAVCFPKSATTNPGPFGNLHEMPALTSFVAAHVHLQSSIIPWLGQNPLALAAAAAVTTCWPGIGLHPPPSCLPLRPPSPITDRFNVESSGTEAAAMAAAAAASFADASAWLASHRTFAHLPNVAEGRSLYKPNPVVHSALAEEHQPQDLPDSSEGSKNGDSGCEQQLSEEHEASTIDGMPEITTHPNPIADNHFPPSASNLETNLHQCEKETLKMQDNPGHNSSTDCSSNKKKTKKRNGLDRSLGSLLFVDSQNDLQDSAQLSVHCKKIGKQDTEVNSREMDPSPSMYQGNNPPKLNIFCKIRKEDEKDSEYSGKTIDALDTLTSSVLVTNRTLEEQGDSSVGKTQNHMAPQCITNKVPITANRQRCVSRFGSTENKKGKTHDSPVASSNIKNMPMKKSEGICHTGGCASEITPNDGAGKVLVQACLERWQGGQFTVTHSCTNSKNIGATRRGSSSCRAEAKESSLQQEEANSSLAMGLANGSKQSLSLIQNHTLHDSRASRSESNKYIGHGFVPYRRA